MNQSSSAQRPFACSSINGKFISRALLFVAFVIVTISFFYCIMHKDFESDEAESLAAATSILKGNVPYRDFYEIHTPLFYYFLVPFCFFFDSMKVVFILRFEIFLLTLLNGYLICKILRRFLTFEAVLLGFIAYLTCLPIYCNVVRPDLFVAVFSNLSLWFLINEEATAESSFFLAGLSAALALLSKQSGIFCILSILILFFLRLVLGQHRFWSKTVLPADRFNFKNYAVFFGGLLLPLGAFYLYLSSNRAWDGFLHCAVNNDFLNLYLSRQIHSIHWYPLNFIKEMFKSNYLLFVSMAVLPFYLFLNRDAVYARSRNYYFIIAFFSLVSFGSLFRILHPWSQEFLVLSQYLVMLSIAPLYFAYDGVIGFFERNGCVVMGLILNIILLTCLCLVPVTHTFWSNGFHLSDSIKGTDKILSLTNKEDKIFSSIPVPFRQSVYYMRIGFLLIESPVLRNRVEDSLMNEILNSRVVVVVPNYRYDKMKRLIALIKANYTIKPYGFYVPGRNFKSNETKDSQWLVPVEGYYRIQYPFSVVLVDNKPVAGDLIYLTKERHHIFFTGIPTGQLNDKETCLLFYDLKSNKKAA